MPLCPGILTLTHFYWNKPEDVLVSLIILNCTNALKMTFCLRFYEMKLDKNFYSKRDLFVKETSIYILDNFRVQASSEEELMTIFCEALKTLINSFSYQSGHVLTYIFTSSHVIRTNESIP